MKHSTKSKLLSVIMAGMMATSIGAVSASAASLPQIQLQAPQSITVLQDTANKAKSDLQALKDSAPKLSTQFDKTPILGQGSLFGSSAVKDAGYGKAKAKTPTGKIIAPCIYNDVELYAGESKGSRVCPGGHSGHYDTITYTKNGKRHKVMYPHLRNHSGHWYIVEIPGGAQFHSQY